MASLLCFPRYNIIPFETACWRKTHSRIILICKPTEYQLRGLFDFDWRATKEGLLLVAAVFGVNISVPNNPLQSPP